MDTVPAATNAARICGLALLITATMVDPTSYRFLARADIQIIIAAVVVFLVLFVDHIFGFLLGLTVLVMYSRVFMHKYGINLFDMGRLMDDSMNSNSSGARAFVTPKNLEDAQSNVFDPIEFNKPYKGVTGVYGESVYSAQGIDGQWPGIPTMPYENIGTF